MLGCYGFWDMYSVRLLHPGSLGIDPSCIFGFLVQDVACHENTR